MVAFINDNDKAQLAGLLPDELLYDGQTACICSFSSTGGVTGVLAARPADDLVWDIPFIFVESDARRQRIATEMLSLLALTLKPMDIYGLTLSFMSEQADDELLAFAEKNGFFAIEASKIYEFPLSAVRGFVDKMKKPSARELKSTALSKVTKTSWNALLAELRKNKKEKGDFDKYQLYMLPHEREVYDGAISRVLFNTDGAPLGALLMRIDTEGSRLIIDYLVNFRHGDSKILLIMFRDAYLAAKKAFPLSDATISFHAFNPQIKVLGNALLKDAVTEAGRAIYMEKKI